MNLLSFLRLWLFILFYSILSCSCLVRQKGNSRFGLPDTTAFLFFLYMQVDVNAYLQGLGVLLVSV